MSDYVPDEEQVREQYTREQPPHIGTVAGKRAEFDRFIDRIKAEAWDEGNRAGASDQAAWDGWRYHPSDKHPIPHPYREEE